MRKLFLFLIFCVLSLPAFALETIKNFHSDILVQTDGSVLVTESITVNREGNKIRRGIYRDLPRTKGVRYSVVSVRRDGEEESYFTERVGRYFRINTGNDDYLPRNGLYTFEITYQASNVILGFDNYDEIYWNVTGNEWIFPIERASAKVFLPEGAKEIQRAGYVGSYGSKTPSDYNLDTGVFSASNLRDGSGLTVAVGFDKGFVTITNAETVPLNKYVEYAVLILGAYLLFTWYLFGRDPEKDAIMPRYHGLTNLTAAQAGWIYSYGHNRAGCLAAALLQGGVSGFFRIKDNSGLTIDKIRPAKSGEEKMFENNLSFPLTLKEKYSPAMERFMNDFEKFLKQKAGEQYFTSNTLWLVLGCVLTLALTAGLCFLAGELPLAGIMGFYLLFFIPAGKALISGLTAGKFPFSSLFILGFVSFHFSVMTMGITAEIPETRVIVIFYILSCISLLVYSYLIIRPTYEGMQVIAHIDGIKMFLKAVEPTLPSGVNTGKMEELLPYAFLLGLEKEWEAKMKIALAGAVYKPTWYCGRHFSSRSFSNMQSTVSKSCTRPSKSGSGGGGFSGGGFGGGGGGGR